MAKKSEKQIKITLIKSTNNANEVQKNTVIALGLKKLHSSKIQPDNEAIRGMIFRVNHMVKVEEV